MERYYYKTECPLPYNHFEPDPESFYPRNSSLRGFDQVDKFLKNSQHNDDFFSSALPPSTSASSYLERPVRSGGGSFPVRNEKLPIGPSLSTSSYSQPSFKVRREESASPGAILSASPPPQTILYADEEERRSVPPPVSKDYAQLYASQHALPESNLDNYVDHPAYSSHYSFLREKKRRKSSAFKSLRSFLKKHLRFSSQAAGNHYPDNNNMVCKKISTASLYGVNSRASMKPTLSSSSTHNMNGVGSARLRTDETLSTPLARAQSFSSSKFKNPKESVERESRAAYKQEIGPLSSSKAKAKCSSLEQSSSAKCQATPKLSCRREHEVVPKIPARSSSAVPPPINRESKRKFIEVSTPCILGILNHGNTCYMNAILQCLACIDRFAIYFVCQHFDNFSSSNDNFSSIPNSITSNLALTLQNMWFNTNSEVSCLKLLRLIASANPLFQISCQQDAQESLIWLLDRIHEEIKDDHLSRLSNSSIKFHKSEEELASDALRRVSGSNRSAIMDLFRAQFRSSMECGACGFFNLTFDPYMTVSLSVPQPKSSKTCNTTFIPFFDGRQIVRYKISLLNAAFPTCISHIKEKIMSSLGGSANNAIACQFSNNGHCYFLANDLQLGGEKVEKLDDFFLVETPRLSQDQELQDMVVAVITHVVGFVPNGGRRGQPYTVVISRQWNYERISRYIIEKGTPFMFSKAYFPLKSDFRLLIQHSSEGVIYLDNTVSMPLFNEHVNRSINNRHSGVLKIIVEWNSNAGYEFLRKDLEPIINDYTFFKDTNENSGISSGAVTLLNLLQDYTKTEIVADWKCPKCFESSSGKKELKFHSMPPVLVFHLKRFELLNDGATKKVESRVQIPLEALDMSPYICNPDSRHSTLVRSGTDKDKAFQKDNGVAYRKGANEINKQEYPLYDLVGVVHHFGERTNSGHYTATTRNPVDNRWRTFDDIKVTFTNPSDIRSSTNAYLLFYERRSDASKLTGSASWFPYSVPESIVSLYTSQTIEPLKVSSHPAPEYENNGLDEEVTVSGSSAFYTGVGGTLRSEKKPSNIIMDKINSSHELLNQSPARSKSYQTLEPSVYSSRVSFKNRLGSNDVLASRVSGLVYPPPSYRR